MEERKEKKGYVNEVILFVLYFRIEWTMIYMFVRSFCCFLWRLPIVVYMMNFFFSVLSPFTTSSKWTYSDSDVLRQMNSSFIFYRHSSTHGRQSYTLHYHISYSMQQLLFHHGLLSITYTWRKCSTAFIYIHMNSAIYLHQNIKSDQFFSYFNSYLLI
jgi:hypothetical protein